MKITLRAKTTEGVGGKEYFVESYNVSKDKIPALIRKFSLKYGVDLDKIEVIENE